VGSKKENRVKNIEKRFLLAKVWEQKKIIRAFVAKKSL